MLHSKHPNKLYLNRQVVHPVQLHLVVVMVILPPTFARSSRRRARWRRRRRACGWRRRSNSKSRATQASDLSVVRLNSPPNSSRCATRSPSARRGFCRAARSVRCAEASRRTPISPRCNRWTYNSIGVQTQTASHRRPTRRQAP